MGNMSPKSTFFVLLAFTVMIFVTVEIVEANRLLYAKLPLPVLHLEAPSVKPQGFGFCKPPCKELCVSIRCQCVCTPAPKV
ncbi:hypothetical protein AALP_AA7G232700 [Arabis alpina]|uniref:Transmembrane protein n=1 Tax=Arabis alpina TaxID=50452 RepID=A0A087GK12_ARAAL|nr:hypothetical protein AALP_AA7G232700 [Arabis alpina]